MREQRAEHRYIPRRASAPAQTTEQQSAVRHREPAASSRHQIGHWAGMHPEDQPQQTYPSRASRYVDWDEDNDEREEEEEDRFAPPTARLRPSAIRRDVMPTRRGRYLPAGQHQEHLRRYRHPHWMVRLGLALSLVFLSWLLLVEAATWTQHMNKPAPLLDEIPHGTQDEPSPEQPPSENEQDTTAPEAAHAGSPASGAAETHQPGEPRAVAGSPPRIVEGSLVESILLSEAAYEAPDTEEAAGTALSDAPYPTSQPPPRTRLLRAGALLTAWLIPILLVGTLLLAQFVPGLADPLSRVVPGLLPSAMVTIVPISEDLHLTAAITAVTGTPDERHHEVGARLLSVTTPAVAQTVPTTGKGHTAATHAIGTLTFYNEAPYPQTIASGTVLTGADGVQVVTNTPAFLQAGNPPRFGVVTVPAHAVLTGPGGNIAAFDMNGLCCKAGVAVKNLMAFTGGQRAHDFAAVAQQDVQQVIGPLATTLTKSAQETLTTQVHPNEQVVSPRRCTPTVHSDRPVGGEATRVTVTVTVTCPRISSWKDSCLKGMSWPCTASWGRSRIWPWCRNSLRCSWNNSSLTPRSACSCRYWSSSRTTSPTRCCGPVSTATRVRKPSPMPAGACYRRVRTGIGMRRCARCAICSRAHGSSSRRWASISSRPLRQATC
jgi:hypothetical protein